MRVSEAATLSVSKTEPVGSSPTSHAIFASEDEANSHRLHIPVVVGLTPTAGTTDV